MLVVTCLEYTELNSNGVRKWFSLRISIKVCVCVYRCTLFGFCYFTIKPTLSLHCRGLVHEGGDGICAVLFLVFANIMEDVTALQCIGLINTNYSPRVLLCESMGISSAQYRALYWYLNW